MPLAAALSAEDAGREKRSVALRSVAAAGVVTILKAVVGILTGSLGVLSDAAHSGLDLLAAIMTYFSVRISDRPADDSHPYGHGKVENLSAFVEIILLVATCIWISIEAARRLFVRTTHVEPTLWAFAVMGLSMTVDVFRSRALGRVARKYGSQALEADAFHFSADILSSGIVIIGLILVRIAQRTGVRPLQLADPLAALVVAAIVGTISVRLGLRAIDTLVDAAPRDAERSIRQAIADVGEVVRRDRIRVRQSGNQLFVDLRLTLGANIPFEHVQSVVSLVESRVREVFPTADVLIHASAEPPPAGDAVEKIRAIAHRDNYQVHDVTAYAVRGKLNVHLDLELDPALTLLAAHEQATRLEEDIQREIQEVDEINIHLEPRPVQVEAADVASIDGATMQDKLIEIARNTPGLLDCHSVEAHSVGENFLVQLHCTLEPDLPLARVHDITEDLKFRLREAFPRITKISIHAEPQGQS